MAKQITLYGVGTSRSSRCRWTLLELGLDFGYVDNSSLIGTSELKKMQPLGKLPAIVIDGESFLNRRLYVRTCAISIPRKTSSLPLVPGSEPYMNNGVLLHSRR